MSERWFNYSGDEEDVVLSTRVRVARNLKDYRFPELITEDEARELTDAIVETVDMESNNKYEFFSLEDMDSINRTKYIENHLISPRLIKNPSLSSFFLREDESISIMVNEEDHIRIQSLLPGLNLEKAWTMVDKLDDELESKLDYAFDEDLGYLTSCPTNVGTGLRASAMVHIPALSMSGYIDSLIQGLGKIGLTVRGIYGEGSEALGNLYQISNQVTLGDREEDIIEKLKRVIYQVIDKERKVRSIIMASKEEELEDRIYRSLGILKNARIMSSREAMAHISNIRLGIETGILDDLEYREITELIISVQPANIQICYGESNKYKRDFNRAKFIREYFMTEEV